MRGRSGPFWDGVEGRAPVPRAAATLGFELIDADVGAGTIEVAFAATEAFTNPSGDLLGAFQAAMLHDTVWPAPLATLGARPVPVDPPAERALPAAGPARPGHQQGPDRPPRQDLVLLEAVLSDADGAVIATATATARVIPLRDAPAAA
jgi:hypothetical protein